MEIFWKTQDLLDNIENHILDKKPFSMIRIGDGDIKIIHELLNSSDEKLKENIKFKKMSLHYSLRNEMLRWYSEYSNKANCISSFDEYFKDDILIKREFSYGTFHKVKNWRNYYKKLKIENNIFISPDSNHYIFLNIFENNLYKIIKKYDLSVCLVTSYPNTIKKFREKNIKTDLIIIPGRYTKHYLYYNDILEKIEKEIKKYDLFMVGGGVYARLYCGFIKDNRGIGLDVGKTFDRLEFGKRAMPERFRKYMNCEGGIELKFNNKMKNIKELL